MAQTNETIPLEILASEEIPSINSNGRLRRVGMRIFRKGAEILTNMPGSENFVPYLRLAASETLCRFQYGRGDMPLVVGIETTSICNRKCSYCTQNNPEFRDKHPTKYMSADLYTKIIQELAEFQRTFDKKGFCGTLHLNGFGEPLKDPSIISRVEEARNALAEARIGFYSNGDLLTEDKYLQLRAAGIDEILITPHGGQHPKKLVSLATKYKQDRIITLLPPLVTYSNRGGEVELGDKTQQSPVRHCIHPTYALEITSNGVAIYCANDSMLRRPRGNVAESSIMSIWDDPTYVKLRRDLRRGNIDRLPDVCLACRTNGSNPSANNNA